MTVLEAENVSLSYSKKRIVHDLNMKIFEGELVSIIGPNGSGKTTILKAFSRLIKIEEGKIFFRGIELNKINTKKLAEKIAILPQVKTAPDDITVETLVGYGRFPHLKFGSKVKKKDLEIIDWAIENAGMTYLRHRAMGTLSGGERQRAWIAMALAQKPEVLLLDEPTTFLDISYQLEVMELVKELNKSLGFTILMVLHDLNHAARYSHRIYAVKDGRIHSYGKPCELLTGDLLRDVFDIEADFFEDSKNNCPFFIPQRVTRAG